MSCRLVCLIPLKNICSGSSQINNDLQLTCMSCQMQGGPLLNTACNIQIELLQVFVCKLLVELDNRIHAFFLALSDSCMQRSPVIMILLIDFCSIHCKKLQNMTASLWIL